MGVGTFELFSSLASPVATAGSYRRLLLADRRTSGAPGPKHCVPHTV